MSPPVAIPRRNRIGSEHGRKQCDQSSREKTKRCASPRVHPTNKEQTARPAGAVRYCSPARGIVKEKGPASDRSLDVDATTMTLDNSARDIQTQAHPAWGTGTGPVRIEEFGEEFRLDPGARYLPRRSTRRRRPLAGQRHRVAGATELQCVADQVLEHPQDAVTIALDEHPFAFAAKEEGNLLLLGERLMEIQRFPQDVISALGRGPGSVCWRSVDAAITVSIA